MEILRTNRMIFYFLWWIFCLTEAAAGKSHWSESTMSLTTWLDPRQEAALPFFFSSLLCFILSWCHPGLLCTLLVAEACGSPHETGLSLHPYSHCVPPLQIPGSSPWISSLLALFLSIYLLLLKILSLILWALPAFTNCNCNLAKCFIFSELTKRLVWAIWFSHAWFPCKQGDSLKA